MNGFKNDVKKEQDKKTVAEIMAERKVKLAEI